MVCHSHRYTLQNMILCVQFTDIQIIQPFAAHPNQQEKGRESRRVGGNPIIFKFPHSTKAAGLQSPSLTGSSSNKVTNKPTTEVPCQHEMTHPPPKEDN